MKFFLQKAAFFLAVIILFYIMIASIWFRWSKPDNTETEVFLEVISFGAYGE